MAPEWFARLTPFHEALRSSMKKRGLTQQEFADKIGYSRSFVAHVLTGAALPPLKTIADWIKVLDLDQPYADYLHDLAALACADDRVLHMFDPKHPAWQAIHEAQARTVMENSVAYQPGESVDYLKGELAAAQEARQAAEAQVQELKERLSQVQRILGQIADVAAPLSAGPTPPPKKVP